MPRAPRTDGRNFLHALAERYERQEARRAARQAQQQAQDSGSKPPSSADLPIRSE